MARLPIDFNAVEDKKFPTYPNGRYTLRISELRQEASKASGELKLSTTFEIVNGPNGSTEFAGKKIFASYSLQQKAGFRVKKLLAACRVPPEQMGNIDDEALVGCTIMASIATEKYNGNDQNRVQNEEPVESAGAVAAAPAAPAPSGFAPAPGAPPAVPPGQWGPPPGWTPPAAGNGQAPPAGWTPPATGAPAPPPAKPVGQ